MSHVRMSHVARINESTECTTALLQRDFAARASQVVSQVSYVCNDSFARTN